MGHFGQIGEGIFTCLGESNGVHCFFSGKELIFHLTRRGIVHGSMVKLVEGDMTKGEFMESFLP